MKKLIGLVIALGLFAPMAMADNGGAACGIGATLLRGKSGVGPHLSATFTDSFVEYGNLLSLTTGNFKPGFLGCDPKNSVIQRDMERRDFAKANQENLSRDMAAGQGEYLSTFSGMMGCSPEAQAQFARVMQAKYSKISANADMVEAVKLEMAADPRLASACSLS
ncbi:MAG: DUF3015 domain-containing protein [Deltaproteobacteria bacterium]|nr:DUF3015 domain-containing protein [Deltaproteobacteria bacterium]